MLVLKVNTCSSRIFDLSGIMDYGSLFSIVEKGQRLFGVTWIEYQDSHHWLGSLPLGSFLGQVPHVALALSYVGETLSLLLKMEMALGMSFYILLFKKEFSSWLARQPIQNPIRHHIVTCSSLVLQEQEKQWLQENQLANRYRILDCVFILLFTLLSLKSVFNIHIEFR